jgi:hypothetical protein
MTHIALPRLLVSFRLTVTLTWGYSQIYINQHISAVYGDVDTVKYAYERSHLETLEHTSLTVTMALIHELRSDHFDISA